MARSATPSRATADLSLAATIVGARILPQCRTLGQFNGLSGDGFDGNLSNLRESDLARLTRWIRNAFVCKRTRRSRSGGCRAPIRSATNPGALSHAIVVCACHVRLCQSPLPEEASLQGPRRAGKGAEFVDNRRGELPASVKSTRTPRPIGNAGSFELRPHAASVGGAAPVRQFAKGPIRGHKRILTIRTDSKLNERRMQGFFWAPSRSTRLRRSGCA